MTGGFREQHEELKELEQKLDGKMEALDKKRMGELKKIEDKIDELKKMEVIMKAVDKNVDSILKFKVLAAPAKTGSATRARSESPERAAAVPQRSHSGPNLRPPAAAPATATSPAGRKRSGKPSTGKASGRRPSFP